MPRLVMPLKVPVAAIDPQCPLQSRGVMLAVGQEAQPPPDHKSQRGRNPAGVEKAGAPSNNHVAGARDRPSSGEVAERLNALVSKTSMELVSIGGSNPPFSALCSTWAVLWS